MKVDNGYNEYLCPNLAYFTFFISEYNQFMESKLGVYQKVQNINVCNYAFQGGCSRFEIKQLDHANKLVLGLGVSGFGSQEEKFTQPSVMLHM